VNNHGTAGQSVTASGSAPSREEVFHVEQLLLWLLIVMFAGSEILLIVLAVRYYYDAKRLAALESRVNDIDVWTDCVDNALDPATSFKVKDAYITRKRAGE